MPFNGNGQFDPASPQYPAIVDTLILAATWNAIVADLAAGLSLAWTRDGQAGALANLSMGGFKLRDVGNAVNPQDALPLSQSATLIAAAAFNSGLPGQSAATINKLVVSDGTNASWQLTPLSIAQGGTNGATMAAARASLGIPVSGQCQLILSAGVLKLIPFNGNLIPVNGVACTIPDAGVTLAATGLPAVTFHYIYVRETAGVITSLEASTVARIADTAAGNKGVQIKTGDPTRTLVGLAYTEVAATFSDTPALRYVRSWFNDTGLHVAGASTQFTSNNTTFVEFNVAARIKFIARAGDFGYFSTTASGFTASLGNTAYSSISVDTTTGGTTTTAGMSDTANAFTGMSSSLVVPLTEGFHFLGPSGRGTGGFSFTVSSSVQGRIG